MNYQGNYETRDGNLMNIRPIWETKVVQVDNTPSVINETNNYWAKFGWSVQNVQITHSQDTKTYTKSFSDYYTGSKTVETVTINYATITYQRDKNMPNYGRISALEAELDRIEGNILILSYDEPDESLNPILLVALLIFLFPVGVIYYLNYRSKVNKARENAHRNISGKEYEALQNRKMQILNEVERLI